MKKLLLASAIAALSITAVQAAPTVYGKVFLSLDIKDGNDPAKANTDFDTRSKLNSNASRLGVKGSEALTNNTDVIYQLEYRLDTDTDGQRNWESRDTYLGLANKELGTLVAGRLTNLQEYINYANVTKGGVLGGDDPLSKFNGTRANNAFAYFSPSYEGVQFMGMYVLDENNDTDTLKRDAWGVGAKYEPANSPLKAGITYIKAGVNATNEATLDQSVRGSVAYAVNPALTVAGQVQLADGLSSAAATKKEKESTYTISGSYKVAQTPWTAYAQADFVDNAEYFKDAEKQRLVIGSTYGFNKNATGHLYGAYMQEKGTGVPTEKAYGIGAGLEYKF